MASVNFIYRSKKPEAFLTARFFYRKIGQKNPSSVYAKTREKVKKEYWDKKHKKRTRDFEILNQQIRLNKTLLDIETFVVERFENSPIDEIDKKWLQQTINLYYTPKGSINKQNTPKNLIDYIEYFLEKKRNTLSLSIKKQMRVTKNKMIRLEEELGYPILLENIDEQFFNTYLDFCKKENYKFNTIEREWTRIKRICREAEADGFKFERRLDRLVVKKSKNEKEIEVPYLSFEELEHLANFDFKKEAHKNARDWLILSCYTGQRVSDFLRFKKEMIYQDEEGRWFLNLTQVKDKENIIIPLASKAREVLEKRNGEFPRKISEQKYNKHIKDLCKIAGFDKMMYGSRRKNINKGKKDLPKVFRDVIKMYPKHELITSHIGRRSFATNFEGRIPRSLIMKVTGHKKESTFLKYIKKSDIDFAKQAYDAIENLNY